MEGENIGRVEEMLKKIIKTQKNIKDCLAGLTEEVASIKRELKRKRRREMEPAPKILPTEPLQEFQEFELLEESLKNENNFEELVKGLQGISGRNAENFVRNCWRAIISDNVATNITWMGTQKKKSAQHCMTTAAMKRAFQKMYKEEPINTFAATSRKHFQYAKDRLTKKAKYKQKEKLTE